MKYVVLRTDIATGATALVSNIHNNDPQVVDYEAGVKAVAFMNDLFEGMRTYQLVEYTETEIDENVTDTTETTETE